MCENIYVKHVWKIYCLTCVLLNSCLMCVKHVFNKGLTQPIFYILCLMLNNKINGHEYL